jgi:hypothetical protein
VGTTRTPIPQVSAAALTSIVRQASGRAQLELQDWSAQPLGGGVGNPVSVGLFRFQGYGHDQDGGAAWSVILKMIQSPANVGEQNAGEGDDQTHWNYWKRELLIYQSSLHGCLPDGLAAPRCFLAEELPGDMAWLWQEDITDACAGAWSLERYALAARHLGRLNGMDLDGGGADNFPWLGREVLRQWVDSLNAEPPIAWDEPPLCYSYRGGEANPFRRFISEAESFLPLLYRCPHGICHGDTYPTNLMSRTSHTNQEETVALDWALSSYSPIGDDLGQVVLGAQISLPGTPLKEIDQALFTSYLDGLRDSGCRADPDQVRFGYTVSAALRVGLFAMYMLQLEPVQSQAGGAPPAADAPAAEPFEAVMARYAYECLERLR